MIKDGGIVLEKGYGYRDRETDAPVTTATLFNIGSISKSFTALGIAQLVDQHQVDLDTPVIRYIPELRLSDPRATQAVTLRQLLSHTSGLPPDEQWPRQVPPTREGIVREFVTMPITAQPGARFHIVAGASSSQPMPSNRSSANPGKRTLGHTSLYRSGWPCLIRASRAGAGARPSPAVSP